MDVNTTTLVVVGELDSYYKSTLTLYNVTTNYPSKFQCRATNENGEIQSEVISFGIAG
jgi:hypothetical protein